MPLRFVVLAIALSLVFAAPASAQKSKAQSIYNKVKKHQKKGRHDLALRVLKKHFKAELPVEGRLLKARSLVGTDKAEEAFKVLAEVRTSAGEHEAQVKSVLNHTGKKLSDRTLKVKSTPEGATIQIDGVDSGKTPADVSLKPGHHEIKLQLASHDEWTTSVFVGLDNAGYVSADLAGNTGHVIIIVDQSGLNATVAGKPLALKEGKNEFKDFPSGSTTVTITDAKGNKVHEQNIPASGAEGAAEVKYLKYGTVNTPWKDATVEIEAKEGEKSTKSPKLRLAEGNYTVILRRPGHYPVKGSIAVKPGQAMTLTNKGAAIPNRSSLELWSLVGVGVGLTAVAAATALELADMGDEGALDITKFALAGVGGALFVASGAILKWVRDEKNNPPATDATIQFQVGATPLKNGGFVSASGSF